MTTTNSVFKNLVSILLLIIVSSSLIAQNREKNREERLDSAVVTAGKRVATTANGAFSVGSNVERAPKELLEKMQSSSLADYLKEQSAVTLKEYGRGAPVYLSVRGTSSSHTSITWNGMTLSVPTLGQTNLSHIPLYFFDKMVLYPGGSALLFGEGSIGGSLELKSGPTWKRGFSGDLLLSGASFATLYGGATLRYSNATTEFRSSLFYTESQNSYHFLNNSKPGLPKERLNNSSYLNFGALQEIYKRFKDSSLLTFNLWYLSYDREIQPSIPLNDRQESWSSIVDNNLRASLDWSGSSSHFSYGANFSFSHDYERYKEDIIESLKGRAALEGEYREGDFIVKGGGSFEYIKPSAKAISSLVEESRGALYIVARYSPTALPSLLIATGVRGGWVTNNQLPLMPSLELNYSPIRANGHTLSLRGSLSKNGKVPSLNDRYWGGDHNYLRSEKSITGEGGADYHWFRLNSSFTLSATLYKSGVKDWIRWIPAGEVWRPQNLPEVLSKGVEFSLNYKKELAKVVVASRVSYNYTSVVLLEGLWGEDPSVGKQLAFQPRHSYRATLSAQSGGVEGSLNFSHIGERTTLDLFDILKPYNLIDIAVGYKGRVVGRDYRADFVVKNVTNRHYQNVKFYAMPGRNWQLTLRYFF